MSGESCVRFGDFSFLTSPPEVDSKWAPVFSSAHVYTSPIKDCALNSSKTNSSPKLHSNILTLEIMASAYEYGMIASFTHVRSSLWFLFLGSFLQCRAEVTLPGSGPGLGTQAWLAELQCTRNEECPSVESSRSGPGFFSQWIFSSGVAELVGYLIITTGRDTV